MSAPVDERQWRQPLRARQLLGEMLSENRRFQSIVDAWRAEKK